MSDFEALKANLIAAKSASAPEVDLSPKEIAKESVIESDQEIKEPVKEAGSAVEKEQERPKNVGRLAFKKGEQVWEIDDDAEIELVADKKTTKLTARQMRDAASGDVAIRSRMRELAEAKKSVDAIFKDFSRLSKEDPLKALERMIEKAQEADPDLTYDSFLQALADQAAKLSEMDEKDRKNWDLERKLQEKQKILEEKDKISKLEEKAQSLMAETGINSDQFQAYADALLQDPVLAKQITSEEDLIDRVGELVEEIGAQHAAEAALRKVHPSLPPQDPLIFELASVLKQNPDFTPKDVEDIASYVLEGQRKEKAKIYSDKARMGASDRYEREKGLSDVEILKRKLLERRKNSNG